MPCGGNKQPFRIDPWEIVKFPSLATKGPEWNRTRGARGSVFASSEHLFPRLFPAFRNSRTGTTAARISSIKTFSRLSCTLMPRERGAGSGYLACVHEQTPQPQDLSAPITPGTTQVRSPVSLGAPVKSACEWRNGGGARGVLRAIGHATRRSGVGQEACNTKH